MNPCSSQLNDSLNGSKERIPKGSYHRTNETRGRLDKGQMDLTTSVDKSKSQFNDTFDHKKLGAAFEPKQGSRGSRELFTGYQGERTRSGTAGIMS